MGGQIRRGRIWRFWGAPIFSPEVPKYLLFKGLGPLDGKSGRPKNAKFNHDGSRYTGKKDIFKELHAEGVLLLNHYFGHVSWVRGSTCKLRIGDGGLHINAIRSGPGKPKQRKASS